LLLLPFFVWARGGEVASPELPCATWSRTTTQGDIFHFFAARVTNASCGVFVVAVTTQRFLELQRRKFGELNVKLGTPQSAKRRKQNKLRRKSRKNEKSKNRLDWVRMTYLASVQMPIPYVLFQTSGFWSPISVYMQIKLIVDMYLCNTLLYLHTLVDPGRAVAEG